MVMTGKSRVDIFVQTGYYICRQSVKGTPAFLQADAGKAGLKPK